MKIAKLSVLAFSLAIASAIFASPNGSSAPAVVGDWQGTLDAGGTTLRVVLHVTADKDGKLGGALDSPDQGASGIAITSITYKEPDLHFEIDTIGGSYDGKIAQDGSKIVGTWSQGGGSLPLTFQRQSNNKK